MPLRNLYELTATENCVRHGKGTCYEARVFSSDELQSQLSGIGLTTIPPGSSIGVHPHHDNEEIYLILSGEGIATLDGQQTRVRPGDVMVNHPGGSHGLLNDGNEPLAVFAFAVSTASPTEPSS